MSIGTEYLETVIKRINYYKDLGEKAIEQLREDELLFHPGVESNSIAVIVQHMTGNMLSRWTNFLSEDGEKDWRQRDEEFEIHVKSQQQLLEVWQQGWDCFLQALQSLKEEDLLRTVHIRKEPLSVIDAINRQLAHYSYHIGQMVYIAKMIRDKDWKNLSMPKRKPV